jgi:hypothetical protein
VLLSGDRGPEPVEGEAAHEKVRAPEANEGEEATLQGGGRLSLKRADFP